MALEAFDTIFQQQSGENFQITNIEILQLSADDPAIIIKRGENFRIRVRFEFTEIVGDLHALIKFNMYAHNVETGAVETLYHVYHEENLPEAPPNYIEREFTFEDVQALGTYCYASTVTLPDSTMAAFAIGPFFNVFDTP